MRIFEAEYWVILALLPICAVGVLAAGCGVGNGGEAGPPYSPEEAHILFEIEEGFRVESFAAEPLISDPVAMEIDEDGRIYVVEMHGYPLDVSGSGRIMVLEDADGDGRPDSSTVFADGLVLPTGVMRWKDGVLVSDAPDVLYLEDTDGDNVADVRRVVLTGFALSNPQHNVNSPVYGLDNWIYLANEGVVTTKLFEDVLGDRGDEVRFADRPDAARLDQNASGLSVRFQPDTYELETLASKTQFGHTFDTWGRHLLVGNSNHIYHEVVSSRYLDRNPDLLISSATANVSDHGAAAEVFPITDSPEYQLLTDVGVITSASGLTSYLGGAFPASFEGATFVAESVHNLVHADRLEEEGATFVARRTVEGREFLASRDRWFRPVNFYVGPDGALYVIDYYRQIIEHPEWMSEEVTQSGALYNGSDRGRIWRIVPEEGLSLDWVGGIGVGQLPTAALVGALEHENIWYRRTAQRLLVDRKDDAALVPLRRLIQESALDAARVHALWTLDGLGHLTPEIIAEALRDPISGVRENAIRLAESHLGTAPSLSGDLIQMASDARGREAFQLLLTLGEVETTAARALRERLLFANVEDEWMQVAALSAPQVDASSLYAVALEQLAHDETEGRAVLFHRLGALIGSGGDIAELRSLLVESIEGDSASSWWRAASLEGLSEAVGGRDEAVSALAPELGRVINMFFEQEPRLRAATLRISRILDLSSLGDQARQRAEAVAQDQDADADLRADAVRLLAISDAASHEEMLRSLLHAEEPLPVQLAAVVALREVGNAEVGRFLIQRWASLTPQVRSEAVNVLLQDQERTKLLVDAIEDGRIMPAEVGFTPTRRLLNHSDLDIRERSRALLTSDETAGNEVVEEYVAALQMEGDPTRGSEVYARACATCHQIGGENGVAYGPDLATVRNRQAEFLLMDILLPNRSIADGYEQWVIELESGRELVGVIGSETSTTLTVLSPGETEQTIGRSDISSVDALDMSGMPEGLRNIITVEQMADLLAFIKQ